MASIVIKNLNEKTIPVLPNASGILKPLLWIVQENGVDWMHECGGKGRCTTCKAIVVKGMENLSDKSLTELRYQAQGALAVNERLCCQVKIMKGDIEIEVPSETKLAHLKYSY